MALGSDTFCPAVRCSDKLRALDLVLAEFEQLLGRCEVITETDSGHQQPKQIALLVDWLRPLHDVIVVDSAREQVALRLDACLTAMVAAVDNNYDRGNYCLHA